MIGAIAVGTPYVTTSARSVVNTRKLKVIDMKQTLEEAAHSFAESRSSGSTFPAYYQGFIAGAEWQKDISSAKWQSKQSPWISVEDAIPNELAKGMCQVKYVDGSIDEMAMREVNKWIYPYIKTGYVTHWKPIPSFDEILEANKDVLERIKEKGD
jgi:hypothetical protein